MYPLRKPDLMLQDLVRHWKRNLPGQPPRGELNDLLSKAFWLGELTLHEGKSGPPIDRVDALTVLRDATAIAAARDWDDDHDTPPSAGLDRWCGVEVPTDYRRTVELNLPREREAWTTSLVEAAFAKNARISLKEFPTASRFLMFTSRVRRDEFAAFCMRRGYDPPGWWLEPEVERVPHAPPMNLVERIQLSDEVLLDEMHERITRLCGELSPWDAADEPAKRAEGKGKHDAKRRRLTRSTNAGIDPCSRVFHVATQNTFRVLARLLQVARVRN